LGGALLGDALLGGALLRIKFHIDVYFQHNPPRILEPIHWELNASMSLAFGFLVITTIIRCENTHHLTAEKHSNKNRVDLLLV
jgi:hypothetical protein